MHHKMTYHRTSLECVLVFNSSSRRTRFNEKIAPPIKGANDEMPAKVETSGTAKIASSDH